MILTVSIMSGASGKPPPTVQRFAVILIPFKFIKPDLPKRRGGQGSRKVERLFGKKEHMPVKAKPCRTGMASGKGIVRRFIKKIIYLR